MTPKVEERAKAAWFALHQYERTALGIVYAHGENGYMPGPGAPLTRAALDSLEGLGYVRLTMGKFWLVDSKCDQFRHSLAYIAEGWNQKHGVSA